MLSQRFLTLRPLIIKAPRVLIKMTQTVLATINRINYRCHLIVKFQSTDCQDGTVHSMMNPLTVVGSLDELQAMVGMHTSFHFNPKAGHFYNPTQGSRFNKSRGKQTHTQNKEKPKIKPPTKASHANQPQPQLSQH